MKRLSSILLAGLVAAAAPVSADVYVDNVVIVLDGSGSMKQNLGNVSKMAAAKQAILKVMESVPDTTQVGLLVFGVTPGGQQWVVPLGPKDLPAMKTALQQVGANGGTPLGRFIKLGADRLLEQREKQHGYGSYRLLVVTDGHAGDADLMNLYVPEVVQRGIVLDVIGVAMAERHTLSKHSHSYRKADDPASLQRAIAEVLAEVGSREGGTAGEEAFAELAAIPVELASAALTSLAVAPNEPIGTRPVKHTREASTAQPTVNTSGHASHSQGSQPVRGSRKSFTMSAAFVVMIGFGIALSVLVSLFRKWMG